ncbi:EamA family transporter [Nocardioides gansuensis]|uniref:EamA family transporter n=1 Tax=Nocardioides gansuensis TaxID=2138300 RepID=A0A2T8FFA9_9ACTN|nr:EamA family transporter [Nocardioides gansuensis]PVG84394.1 EamA family transporter [Nocardioides gansuensis]
MVPARGGLVAAALAIVYVVWGSTYLGIKIVVEDAPPMTSMGLRFVTAGLVLGIVLSVAHRGVGRLALTRRQLAGTAFLGLTLPLLGNGLVSIGEQKGATSGYAALLIAVAPLIIVVFRLLEGDMPRPATLVGVALGFVGLAVLVVLGRGAGDFSVVPALIVLFAASCWALGSYVQPRLWLPSDPFVVAVWEMVLGGLMMVATGMAIGERFTFDYPSTTWWALSYLVVFGSVVGFTAYVWLVANAPISLVATYAYVNPVIAVFLGWLILDEAITWPIVAGGTIVVAAVALVISAERKPRVVAPVLEPEVLDAR